MADSSDDRSSGDSAQSHLKNRLTDWRQLVLVLYSVLVWESDSYPIALSSAISLLFLVVWYLETSVLTTLSVIGIVSAILDYSLPIINHNFFDPSKWSKANESKFEQICAELTLCWTTLVTAYSDWQRIKGSNPKMYYAVVLSSLLALCWVGNVVHNLFLSYLFVLFVVLFPGLKQRGCVDRSVTQVIGLFSKLKRN